MSDNQEEILRLQAQLERLVRTQIDFQREVSYIRSELDRLRTSKPADKTWPVTSAAPPPAPEVPPVPPVSEQQKPPVSPPPVETQHLWERYTPPPKTTPPPPPPSPQYTDAPTFGYTASDRAGEKSSGDKVSGYVDDYFAAARENLEKFIGENLISKIGIIILVLGVGIGAKYAIDNGWISETMRIAFAYTVGLALIAVAAYLKSKYLSFSAVLMSGGMAILYFVTYFAYSSYGLLGQPVAFGLMGRVYGVDGRGGTGLQPAGHRSYRSCRGLCGALFA